MERYIAALEISSSKIIGAVGRMTPSGKLNVLAVEQEQCTGCVRYGIVQNVEETFSRIAHVLTRLEDCKDVLPNRINGVFVGLSGRSLHSIEANAELNLGEETVINSDTVARLRSQAETKAIDSSLSVIDAVPRLFTIGSTKTTEPIGNLGSSIKATYDLIVCRAQLKKNIERIDLENRLDVKTLGFIVTPLAAGHIIPSTEEKRRGCMLVDIGAETTSVIIYKDGNLRYFNTIPLGSRCITHDITSTGMFEENAELYKIQSGNARPPETDAGLHIHDIDTKEINKCIVARAEEIAINILEQANYAGVKDSDLPGGIILIGGGSLLNNFCELIQDISKLPVRRGQLPPAIETSSKSPDFNALEVIAVLHAAATHSDAQCVTAAQEQELPISDTGGGELPISNGHRDTSHKGQERNPGRKRGKSAFSKWFGKIGDMLTPGDDEDDELS